jgi:flagellar assembly factor FliW
VSAPTLDRGDDVSVAGVIPLEFPSGIPGFPGRQHYVLEPLDPQGSLFDLSSADGQAVRLLVVPPSVFFPDYAPELDDESVRLLDLRAAEEAQLLVVLTAGRTPREATANLLAPIVINTRTGSAAQVILSGSGLPVRAPVAG